MRDLSFSTPHAATPPFPGAPAPGGFPPGTRPPAPAGPRAWSPTPPAPPTAWTPGPPGPGAWSPAAGPAAPGAAASPAAQRLVTDRYFYDEVTTAAAATAAFGLNQAQTLTSLWQIGTTDLEQAAAYQARTRVTAHDRHARARFCATREAAWARHLRSACGGPPPEQDVRFDHVPELVPVEAAAARFDWNGLLGLLGTINRPEDLDFAVTHIAEMPMLADTFVSLAAQVPQNPLVGTLAARALISYAWDVRGTWPADELTTTQWAGFHRFAAAAEQILGSVVTAHPGYLPAWSSLLLAPVLRASVPNPDHVLQRLTTLTPGQDGWAGPHDEDAFRVGAGFRWSCEHVAERYGRVAALHPSYFPAQLSTVQLLVPKWGDVEQYGWDGPVDEVVPAMHERAASFVAHCTDTAPPGALTHALPAYLHFHRWSQVSWFDEWNDGESKERAGERYFKRPEVQAELMQAVADSVGHPNHTETLYSRQARSLLAWELYRAGRVKDAAGLFATLGDRPSACGWVHEDIEHGFDPNHPEAAQAFTRARKKATGQ